MGEEFILDVEASVPKLSAVLRESCIEILEVLGVQRHANKVFVRIAPHECLGVIQPTVNEVVRLG